MTDETRTEVVELLRNTFQHRTRISDAAQDPVVGRIARDAREYAAEIVTGVPRNTDEFYWTTCRTAAGLVEQRRWP